MAEADLQQFLEKVRQLNIFVAMSEADPALRTALRDCSSHHEVVGLARRHGLDIGRRWGDGALEGARVTDSDEAGTSTPANLITGPCPPPGEEVVTVLAQGSDWRLERIHSCAARSAQGFWYEQQEWEWVALLQGSARLRFADDPVVKELCRGDWLLISPHRRHRLEGTDPAPGSVWLALFWQEASGS